jgi:hypothetical protein
MKGAAHSLQPFWREKSVVLVSAREALRLCRDESYERLPWSRGYALVETAAHRDLRRLREFIMTALRSRAHGASLGDKAVLALLRDGLKSGDLVALKVSDGATGEQTNEVAAQRALVRKIEAATRGRLDVAGQRHLLVAGPDLGKVPGRDNYVVVPTKAAEQILETLANQPGTAPVVKQLFLAAKDELAPAWRAPFSPEGLVLLRRMMTVAASKEPAEVITPSAMKKLLKHWIEIEVVDDKGRPYTGRYKLQKPGGGQEEGNFPDGQWSNHDIDPGECRLTLLPPDGGAAVGDEDEDEAKEGWLSLRMVDSDGNPVTCPKYRIAFADGSSREDAWTDEELRLDDIPPGECQVTLLLRSDPE